MKTNKIPATKQDLYEWICEQVNSGNSVPLIVRGCGIGWIYSAVDAEEIVLDPDYLDSIDVVEDDDILPLFRDFVEREFPGDYTYLLLHHDTGYNQENFDEIFAYWDD